MDDPSRPWGLFFALLSLLVGTALFFHEPKRTPAPQAPEVRYCIDTKTGLADLCDAPWMKRERYV